MASKAVVDAVNAYLAANWTALPVIGPNPPSNARPSGRGSFVAVQYPVANREQITVGAPGQNVLREEGAIRLVVHVNVGEGVDQALTRADELSALFTNKRFSGVETFAASPGAFDDRNEDSGYYRVSLVVPYTYDTFG